MTSRLRLFGVIAAVFLAAGGCTVHQSSVPGLSGPSDLALSLSLTATPDSLAIDGGSQSKVVVEAHDAQGAAVSGQGFRLEIYNGGTAQDCGTLSARNVFTGSDGRAVALYTAPSMPLPFPQCANFAPGGLLTILATPMAANFDTVNPRTATIRLVPLGVLVPPVSFAPSFTVAPSPATAGSASTFDASGSTDPDGAISSYAWGFGDGSTGSGRVTTHAYNAVGVYSVTLTVSDAAGRAVSTTKTVTVNAGTAPKASFTVSPTLVKAGDTVFFSAAGSSAAAGRTIVSYQWDFGDGLTKNLSAATTTHDFGVAGGAANTYTVSLVVVDDLGQRSDIVTKTVDVK